MSDDEAQISYSVKELLTDIRSKLDHMDGKLDGKADKHEVEEIERKTARDLAELRHEMGERIAGLDKARKQADAAREAERKTDEHERSEDRKHRRNITWGFAGSVVVALVPWILAWATHFHP